MSPIGPFKSRRAPRGAKAKGRAYERKLGKYLRKQELPELQLGPWIRFEDENGPGWAQPDVLFRRNGVLFILEAKLTETHSAVAQLEELYLPLCSQLFTLPVVRALVYYNPDFSGISSCVETLPELLSAGPGLHRWHWLGFS